MIFYLNTHMNPALQGSACLLLCSPIFLSFRDQRIRPFGRAQRMHMGKAGQNIFPAQSFPGAVDPRSLPNAERGVHFPIFPCQNPAVMEFVTGYRCTHGKEGIFPIHGQRGVTVALRPSFHSEGHGQCADHWITAMAYRQRFSQVNPDFDSRKNNIQLK